MNAVRDMIVETALERLVSQHPLMDFNNSKLTTMAEVQSVFASAVEGMLRAQAQRE